MLSSRYHVPATGHLPRPTSQVEVAEIIQMVPGWQTPKMFDTLDRNGLGMPPH